MYEGEHALVLASLCILHVHSSESEFSHICCSYRKLHTIHMESISSWALEDLEQMHPNTWPRLDISSLCELSLTPLRNVSAVTRGERVNGRA